VNYRKQQKQDPAGEKMPEESDFRFYAVSTRLPKNMQRTYTFESVANGVYDVRWGSVRICVIVPSQVSNEPKNALWLLFSAVPEKVKTGASEYRFRRDDLSTAVNDLFIRYNLEGIIDMPYTVEDYKRESKEIFITQLSGFHFAHRKFLNSLYLIYIIPCFSFLYHVYLHSWSQ
jgi:hypothetical protein